jgi:PAS domain S-box-containing protein
MADGAKEKLTSRVRSRQRFLGRGARANRPNKRDGHQPAPDNQAVQSPDLAVLGGTAQRVGTFDYHYSSDTWTWSDTVARIHGYEPGGVTPTTELVLGHKHPDDLAEVMKQLQESAAPFSSRHRIRTTSGETRNVVVVGDAVTDDNGRIVGTRGFYIDITDDLKAEVQHGIDEELKTILRNRELIEQAKGVLVALYDIDADSAFSILRWRSQQTNVKLARVAARFVADVPKLLKATPRMRAPIDHYLMSPTPDTPAE